MDISINKITGKIIKGNLQKSFRTGDWESIIDPKTKEIKSKFKKNIEDLEVQEAIKDKVSQIEKIFEDSLVDKVLAKTINGITYYIKTKPIINLFQAALLMSDQKTNMEGELLFDEEGNKIFEEKEYTCFTDEGEKVILSFTKSELINIANHYEIRKNSNNTIKDSRLHVIKNSKSIKEVEEYDVNSIYNEDDDIIRKLRPITAY
mgnify:FL=1|tara:strand:+ start:884 stop:1498 length:615 start_codon:yes stop_codon:yes gene_type:complete